MARNRTHLAVLLASTRMGVSVAEAFKGRLMRSPDAHPAGEAPAEEAPATTNTGVEGVRNIGGGTLEAVAEMPPAKDPAEAPAEEGEALKLPEGYATAEEFAKAVLDGTYKAPETKDPKAEEAPAKGTLTDDQLKEITSGMAPEMATAVEPFVKAFAETGTLTDEQVAAAAKATGMSEPMVRQYMAGAEAETVKQQAADTAMVNRFTGVFGGVEGYDSFQSWAANGGLTDQEAATYTKLLDTAPDAAFALATEYKVRMEAQGGGTPPRDLTKESGNGGSAAVDAYASVAEQNAAVNDPRYQTDEVYRKGVQAKMGRTNL